MKLFLVMLFVLVSVLDAAGQKESIAGFNIWRGRVELVNEKTNEITLSPISGKTDETFVGVLRDKVQVRLLDNSVRELGLSEIPPGMQVRVIYDRKDERVGGQEVKINRIKGVIFLGRDQYDRLRVAMDLPPATAFRWNPSDEVPATNPLKLYIFVQPPRSPETLVRWVEKWNKGAANTYGTIELVTNLEQADFCVLVENREVEAFGSLGSRDVDIMPSASAFLAVPKSGALDVVWKTEPAISFIHNSKIMNDTAKEIEKRLKTRGKP